MTGRIRSAIAQDADQMSALLNGIIAIGGTTAYEDFFDRARMIETYIAAQNVISCIVAERGGEIEGFQGLFRPTPADHAPADWAMIATFVRVGRTGGGVGRSLFAESLKRAGAAGAVAIDATIRADNKSGLGFYSRMGFVDYDRLIGVPLKNGKPVDRIRKRFDL